MGQQERREEEIFNKLWIFFLENQLQSNCKITNTSKEFLSLLKADVFLAETEKHKQGLDYQHHLSREDSSKLWILTWKNPNYE